MDLARTVITVLIREGVDIPLIRKRRSRGGCTVINVQTFRDITEGYRESRRAGHRRQHVGDVGSCCAQREPT